MIPLRGLQQILYNKLMYPDIDEETFVRITGKMAELLGYWG
jgi:hypothetical protein